MPRRHHSLAAIVLASTIAATAALTGCGASVMVHRPTDHVVDHAITGLWVDELVRTAQDGDWLLSRSYSGQGDAVVVLTGGEELSHAAMIDVTHRTVIESIGSGVREIPLAQFVDRNRHLIAVRPSGGEVEGRLAVARARSKIGLPFDIGGMAGLGSDSRFYCSELVYWASGLQEQDPYREIVITPGELLKYGAVVYWSGKRDDPQVQRIAAGWAVAHAPPRVAAR